MAFRRKGILERRFRDFTEIATVTDMEPHFSNIIIDFFCLEFLIKCSSNIDFLEPAKEGVPLERPLRPQAPGHRAQSPEPRAQGSGPRAQGPVPRAVML